MTDARAGHGVGLWLITDPAYGDERILHCVRAVGRALPPYAFGVQLRDKRRDRLSLGLFARALRVATRAVRARLVINGLPPLAREVEADGVHLGGDAPCSVAEARRRLWGTAWISVAAHTDEDVCCAVHDGADAVLVSPVFPSRSPGSTGPWKSARGPGALRAARRIAGDRMDIVALGGVSPGNARACRRAGASAVAVVRAILEAWDPAAVARAIHDGETRRW